MRLKHILFLIFGVMTALPLAFFWFWLERNMHNKEVADVAERHLVIARNLGAALERYQKDVKAGFLLISRNLAMGHEVHRVERTLNDLNFKRISIVDLETGQAKTQADSLGHHPTTKFSPEKLAWLETLAREGEARISPVEAGATGEPVMYVVKKINGFLAVGELRTKYIRDLGKTISFGKDGHAEIVDHKGNVLAHPLPSWVAERRNIVEKAPVKRMLKGEQGVEMFWSPAAKEDMIAGFTAVDGTGWGVMVPQPMAELRERAQLARDSLFYVVASILAVGLLFAACLTPLFTGPMQQVVTAAKRVRSGDLSTRIVGQNSKWVMRELRELQDAFNAMATAVEMHQHQEAQKRRKAEEEAQIRSQYMANLTRELRMPLNSVIGLADTLRKDDAGPVGEQSYQDYVADINTSASRLLRLVNDLMEFSQIDSDAFELNEEHLSIADSLHQAGTALSQQFKDRKAVLEIELPAEEYTLWVDKAVTQKLLVGLIASALRRASMEEPRVRIETKIADTGNAEIRVIDNGPVLSPQEMQQAMHPLVETAEKRAASVGGSGLGLALVAKLARRQDGQLTLESEPGAGTTARLIFPRERLGLKTEVAA